MGNGAEPADEPTATVVDAVAEMTAALEAAKPDLPAELLTPQTFARSGASFGRLHEALIAASVSVADYSGQLRATWAYVEAHPEQVDTVRLMGGDEHDLVTALMTQWLNGVTAQGAATPEAAQTAQAVTDGSDEASDSPAIISLADRRARKRR